MDVGRNTLWSLIQSSVSTAAWGGGTVEASLESHPWSSPDPDVGGMPLGATVYLDNMAQ